MSALRLDLFHDEALDHVADLDVVELLDLHAALVAGGDLLDVVLEAAQGGQIALVDDDVVAQDAHLAAALDLAPGTGSPECNSTSTTMMNTGLDWPPS